jgi:hypothetical protein
MVRARCGTCSTHIATVDKGIDSLGTLCAAAAWRHGCVGTRRRCHLLQPALAAGPSQSRGAIRSAVAVGDRHSREFHRPPGLHACSSGAKTNHHPPTHATNHLMRSCRALQVAAVLKKFIALHTAAAHSEMRAKLQAAAAKKASKKSKKQKKAKKEDPKDAKGDKKPKPKMSPVVC